MTGSMWAKVGGTWSKVFPPVPPPPVFNDATGGTVTTYTRDGKWFRRHTFTSGDTLSIVTAVAPFDYVLVGGGGGAGQSQGGYPPDGFNGENGGAGGVVSRLAADLAVGDYPVAVGAGGAGAIKDVRGNGLAGGTTTFNGLAAGGGKGGRMFGGGEAAATPGIPSPEGDGTYVENCAVDFALWGLEAWRGDGAPFTDRPAQNGRNGYDGAFVIEYEIEEPPPPVIPNDGLAAWFDPSDDATVTVTGGRVTSIKSKVTSPALTFDIIPPGFTAPTATTLNGLRALLCDGTNGLQVGSNTLLSGATGISVYAVMHSTDAGVTRRLFMLNGKGNPGGTRVMLGHTVGQLFLGVRSVDGGQMVGGGFDPDWGGLRVLSGRAAAGASNAVARAKHTSSEVALANAASFVQFEPENSIGAGIGVNVAANQGFVGTIAEMVVYNRRLTDEEDAQVLSYLATKWGVT